MSNKILVSSAMSVLLLSGAACASADTSADSMPQVNAEMELLESTADPMLALHDSDLLAQNTAVSSDASRVEQVEAELESILVMHMARINENIVPSKSEPLITVAEEGMVIISYHEVDEHDIDFEIIPTESPDAEFIAKVSYKEYFYEATVEAGTEATDDDFSVADARLLTEIIRYDGGWVLE